ncbi:MAG: polyribonucleotide nucleotidyltransferase [Pseudomonadota bacterium]
MKASKTIKMAVWFVTLFQLSACGTLLYPERQGQTKGRIDPAVAILNGVGLLVFLVPGLVAFGIDFHTGAIYLPRGSSSSFLSGQVEDQTESTVIRTSDVRDLEKLKTLIKRETGVELDFNDPSLQVMSVNSLQALHAQLISHTTAPFLYAQRD